MRSGEWRGVCCISSILQGLFGEIISGCMCAGRSCSDIMSVNLDVNAGGVFVLCNVP